VKKQPLEKPGSLPDTHLPIPRFLAKNEVYIRQLAKATVKVKMLETLGKTGLFSGIFSIFRNEQVRGSSPLTSTWLDEIMG
jgi:hypothetical protein